VVKARNRLRALSPKDFFGVSSGTIWSGASRGTVSMVFVAP
jgi:hypothetical protein